MSNSSTHDEIGLELVVVSRKKITNEIFEIELANHLGGHLPDWQAGSHADLIFGEGFVRQYSLMRGNINTNNWRMAILADPEGRGGSLYLYENLEIGSIVKGKGPRNHFELKNAKSYSFIAGGIGITPMLPMIEKVEAEKLPWQLSYLGRSRETMAYLDHLEAKYPNRVSVHVKNVGPRFNVSNYFEATPSETHTYVCGPEKLLFELEAAFAGGREHTLHMERFHPREISLEEPDHEFIVYCSKSKIELTVPADESILVAADFAGVEITGDCMEGTCGACETTIIQGEVSHRDSVMSKDAQSKSETMMICVSRARGEKIILDL